MPDFETMYHRLFNAITDALAHMEQANFGLAADCLKKAQTDGEELYISAEE